MLTLIVAAAALVATTQPADAGSGPWVTLEIQPQTVREGRPVTLVAQLHDFDRDFLPAFARFLDPDAKVFSQDVAFDESGEARLRLEPRFSGYMVFAFSESYGAIFGPTTPVDVITGFDVDISFTTVPADAGPGDDALVRVTVAGTPVTAPEGGASPPVPSGLVHVLANANSLGSGTLNGQGKADVPVTMPPSGVPISVQYEGDDLFVDAASASYVPPDQPVAPPRTEPSSPTVTSPQASGDSAVAPGVVPPTPSTPVPTTAPAEVDDDLEVEPSGTEEDEGATTESAAAPAGAADQVDEAVERSSFVDGIPSPGSIDWGAGHLTVNLLLALLLMVLTGIPATLVDKTIEENYHRIVRAFSADEERAIHRVERRLQALPDVVLLVGLSLVTALVFSVLDPSSAFDATTVVLVLALALVVAILISLHDLARLPYLNRRFGRPAAAFGVYPFSLILAALLVLVSRLAGFEPGYVFGIVGTLAVKEAVTERDEAKTLAAVAVGFLGVALLSWWLWHPIVDEVTGPDPSGLVVFLDAFLSGLWLAALQGVVFGFAPMRFLDGGAVRAWSQRTWLAIWAASVFLLVQLYLHPSAGRWGALDSTTMRTALSVWAVFLVGALLFWGWFRYRPDPGNPAELRDEAAAAPR